MPITFRTCFCIDGSAKKPAKRPVYRVDMPANSGHTVARCLLKGKSAYEFFCKQAQLACVESRMLITVDVPIGLPNTYKAVYAEYEGRGGFPEWLQGTTQSNNNREELIVDEVESQAAHCPFVTPKKGDKKADGKFPKRRCEQLTNGESLYWCVGGKQVGKAALQFWFETLAPLRQDLKAKIGIWPFEDLRDKSVVIAECYPAILQRRVWGRTVTKTNPLDVVDAVHNAYQTDGLRGKLQSDRAAFHAVSSEDEFDMFTTALAIRDGQATLECPDDCTPWEGWMIGLPSTSSTKANLA